MAARELKLWVYSGLVCGHRRVLLVADYTVGGAKNRFSGSHGAPSTRNAMTEGTPGFPVWISRPGVWVGIVPMEREDGVSHRLDRYTQDVNPEPPKVVPDDPAAYLGGESYHEAEATVSVLVVEMLKARHSGKLLRTIP